MTTKTEHGPAVPLSCGHRCSEHQYATTEWLELVAATRAEVRSLWKLEIDQIQHTDGLVYRLDHIRMCTESGSHLLELPPQARLYRDPQTDQEVWTFESPSEDAP